MLIRKALSIFANKQKRCNAYFTVPLLAKSMLDFGTYTHTCKCVWVCKCMHAYVAGMQLLPSTVVYVSNKKLFSCVTCKHSTHCCGFLEIWGKLCYIKTVWSTAPVWALQHTKDPKQEYFKVASDQHYLRLLMHRMWMRTSASRKGGGRDLCKAEFWNSHLCCEILLSLPPPATPHSVTVIGRVTITTADPPGVRTSGSGDLIQTQGIRQKVEPSGSLYAGRDKPAFALQMIEDVNAENRSWYGTVVWYRWWQRTQAPAQTSIWWCCISSVLNHWSLLRDWPFLPICHTFSSWTDPISIQR